MKRVALIVACLATLSFLGISLKTALFELPSASAIEENSKARPEKTLSSVAAGDSDLTRSIDRLIDESSFSSARWGVSVISLSDGTPIYSRNANRLFTPASNMKIYTTAVALDLLGGDYRWRTSLYAASEPDSNGDLQGDLVLYGRGAPDLVSQSKPNNEASLAKLAEEVYARGVRHVKGNVVGDESYFRGNSLGDGWQWSDIQWYFGAEASALTVDENEVDVNVTASTSAGNPPLVKATGDGTYVRIDNRMTTGKGSVRSTIGVNRGLSDNQVAVWGELSPGSKGFGVRLSVHNPALWSATILSKELQKRGIVIDGQPQARDSRVAPELRFNPSKFVELASLTSKPLSEIARTTNKESNNLFAELILRTLGRERGPMLETPEPLGRERGDEESGVALVRLWLDRAGISSNGLAIHDGCGLSRLDLVTPESTVRLLLAISKTASGEVFKQTLPIAGKDGTLAGRLRTVAERVTAKTGTLTYDNSLSGYAITADGKVVAFSIFCNDQTGHESSIKLIDEIAALIVTSPNLPAGKTVKTK